MKHREATINILAGAAILIAIALSVNAWTLWNECKLVLEETNKLQTELSRLMNTVIIRHIKSSYWISKRN